MIRHCHFLRNWNCALQHKYLSPNWYEKRKFLGFGILFYQLFVFFFIIIRVLYSGSKITHVYYFFQPQFYKKKEENKKKIIHTLEHQKYFQESEILTWDWKVQRCQFAFWIRKIHTTITLTFNIRSLTLTLSWIKDTYPLQKRHTRSEMWIKINSLIVHTLYIVAVNKNAILVISS